MNMLRVESNLTNFIVERVSLSQIHRYNVAHRNNNNGARFYHRHHFHVH